MKSSTSMAATAPGRSPCANSLSAGQRTGGEKGWGVMAKANPKAWFTSPLAKIKYGPVDKWAKFNERFRPFFPTWKEARDWMLTKAAERLKRAQAELKSATAHHAKVQAMKDPTQPDQGAA